MDCQPEISLIPFTNKTMKAIENLQEMLKCQICKKQPFSPLSMGRCDHFFCESCLSSQIENSCPICKIPSLPCERNPESIVRCLVSSCTDLITLINGGKVEINTQGLEAPESTCPFTDSKENIKVDVSNIKEKKTTTRVASSRNSSINVSSKKLNTNRTPSKSVGSLDSEVINVRSQSRLSKNNLRRKNNANLKSVCQNEVSESNIINDLPNEPKKIAFKSATKLNSNFSIPDVKAVKLTSNSKVPEMRTPKHVLNSKTAEIRTPVTPAIYKRNTKGETLLHSACIKGDLKKVNALLSDGANPNTKDNAGWTPLHEACSNGFLEIAQSLLQHGALVDVPGNDNGTPLHDAVTSGYVDIICLLRKWGASDEIRDLSGRTPRSIADLCKCPKTLHKALDTERDESTKLVAVLEPLQSKMILMESNLSPDYKKKYEKVVKLLKVKTQDDFSIDVTHLIVGCNDSKICSRTIKYLMGVTSGKWILTEKWLDECLALGGPASPEEFEVLGSRSNTTSDAPYKGRKNSFKMNPGLFKGCHIFLSGNFNESFFNKKDLEALIKAGDGITLHREPNPESIPESEQTVPFHSDPSGPLGKCSHYCIYQEGLNEPLLKYDMAHMKSLPLDWLLDCIDNWCLIPPFK